MKRPLICMTLTGKTLEENVQLVKKYEKIIDLVELRADYLDENEQLYIKRFPSLIRCPCILSIRRDVDGGLYNSGEFSRTSLFGRALAFADQDREKNYAYVEFEDDYHIPGIQDAAMAFGIRIIRSCYSLNEPVSGLRMKCDQMRKTGYEIPKITYRAKSLGDMVNLFKESASFTDYEHIFTITGQEGLPSRILATRTNSYLTYTSSVEKLGDSYESDFLTPDELINDYNFKKISGNTKLYGITGEQLEKTISGKLHNAGYEKNNIDAVYIPIKTEHVSEALHFAEQMGLKGLTVTNPHQESVLYYLYDQSNEVANLGISNLIVRRNNRWIGFNTETYGFKSALEDFIGDTKLRRKKVAIIGAGLTARTVAYIIKLMGGKACVFDHNIEKAKLLAEKYGFRYAQLDSSNADLLDEYSQLIVQTIPLDSEENDSLGNDPIYFYNFHGSESLFDINSTPAVTPVMKRASLEGCHICNGYKMLEYQVYAQFKILTDKDLFL